MTNVDPKIAQTITWIAGIVAIVVAAALPTMYFTLSYQSTIADLETEAEINARVVSAIINVNPNMWRFQQYKLGEILSNRPRHGDPEVRRISDNDSKVIAESVDALEAPLITETADLRDAGLTVGRIEISRSLRPLLTQTGWVALFGLLLGWAVFVALRVLPLRALGHALADNVQLYEEASRNLNRIRALHEIDLAITSTLDLHGILHVLLEKIDLVLPYAATTVRLFNPENGLLEPVACRNLDEKEWKTEAWRGGRGLANVAFETNAPTIIGNAQTDPRVRDPEFYRKHKLISYLAIPLIAKEKTLGVIGFYTRQEYDFSNDEVEFLKTLAGQAAIAIHNARLYQEATVREKNLLVAHEQLDALHTITAIASQSLDLKTVTQSVIQKITEIFDFDVTRIHLYNARRDELRLCAHFSKEPERFSPVGSFPRGQGIAGRVAESGEPLIFEDLTMEPLYESMSRSGIPEVKGRRFFAALPIKSGHEVLGTLVCIGFAPRQLSAEEVQLLTSMAAQVGIAVEHARLFAETYQRADELTQKTFDLEKSNRAKDEFLAMISHELRTPLNVMMGYTGLLREGMFGALNPQQDDALKKVVIQSNDLLSIVSNLLRATQIGSGEIKAERARTDLGPLLDEIKNGYDLPATDELTLNWDFPSDLPTVDTDSEKLRHILVNLIHNAIKFTEKGSVTIAARHLPKSKTLRFTVADTGPGIAKESLPLIFDMFHQVDSSNTRAHGGLGLGLYIVKKYTELLVGEVEVKSDLGKGSTFTVTIPCEAAAQRPSWQYDQFEQTL